MSDINSNRPFIPLAGTAPMRDRLRELATPPRDDFDRAVLITLDDFDRLHAFYVACRDAVAEEPRD